jgi:hypothetical protein
VATVAFLCPGVLVDRPSSRPESLLTPVTRSAGVTVLGSFADDPLPAFAWHAAHGSPSGRVMWGRSMGS